jgi:hypothetical protein
VRQALLAEPNNVAPERLVAMGAGSISPVASNLSEEGRGLNRRVEFVLLNEELMDQETATPEVAPYEQSTAKYAANVPEAVTTPDTLETKLLGTLRFFDGMPDEATVEKAYNALDLTRGITAFLDGIRIASVYALLNGYREAGVAPGEIAIHEELMDARSLWLTPNTTTIYIGAQIDLSDGPVVVDAPAGLLGIVDDAAFEYVTDIGAAGPDKGKGGKYLFLPPGYEGDVPEGYFVAQSKSYDHWMVLRASLDENGESAGPVATI